MHQGGKSGGNRWNAPYPTHPLVFNLHTSFLYAYETVVTGSVIDYGRGKSQNNFVKPRELIKVWKMYTSWTKFHVNTKNLFALMCGTLCYAKANLEEINENIPMNVLKQRLLP